MKNRPSIPALKDSPLFVASVEKAFFVLRCFIEAADTLSLNEISKRTGMDKSAAQRFTHTLRALEYLRQDPITRRYSLTSQALGFAYGYLHTHELVRKAMPYLIECQGRCEETVNLTERLETDIVYLARVPSRQVITVNVFVGMRLPLYCTAPGRSMLAFLPADEVNAILNASRLVKHTPFTVTDPKLLLAELEQVRRQGYAMVAQETYLGDASVAAPIFDRNRAVAAAINISAPLAKWPKERIKKELAPMVMQAADAIVNPLGGWGRHED